MSLHLPSNFANNVFPLQPFQSLVEFEIVCWIVIALCQEQLII